MACGLCGRQGHSVLTCNLPGAEAFRKMRRQLKVKQKQAGRKPKEQERLEKKQRKAYSGNSAGKKKQAALEKKTKGGICDVCPLEAVKRLQKLGYLKTVSRCPTCDVGRLSEPFVWQRVTKQVYRKCKAEECRCKMNCLTQSSVFAPSVSRGLSPQQVYTAVAAYTNTGSGKTPGTVRQAKLLGCGMKALTRLYDSLRQHEARLGRLQCESFRLRGQVECDGSSVRSIIIGLDPNPMPFFFDSTMEKRSPTEEDAEIFPALHQGARCGADK